MHVLLSHSFGFPATLTVGQLRVGKTCANCWVCVDPDVCDRTEPYDPQCGHDETPSHGYCVWQNDQNTCKCNQGFTGPHCGDGGRSQLPVTMQQVIGIAAGVLSIAVSLYVSRKYAIARLRSRHRAPMDGGRTPEFDCRDRITIALLCGSSDRDRDGRAETEAQTDPLMSKQQQQPQKAQPCLRPLCCCPAGSASGQLPRGEFASAQSQSRDEFSSAQSHASAVACQCR